MKTLRLYRPVVIVKQDYSQEKPVTVPNQSMTLREIIKRFTRKESLPIEKEGTFITGHGDLEKFQHADLVDKHERLASVRKRTKELYESEQKRAAADANPPPKKAGGESPSGGPPPAPDNKTDTPPSKNE